MAVDDAGLRRMQRRRRRSAPAPWRRAAAPSISAKPSTPLVVPCVRIASILRDLGVLGRDDQLAAFAVRHAVRGTELVQHAPAARAVTGAQRAGRVVHAAVDHLAVARGHAGADAPRAASATITSWPAARPRARPQPDHAGADHQYLHCDFPCAPSATRRYAAADFMRWPKACRLTCRRPAYERAMNRVRQR